MTNDQHDIFLTHHEYDLPDGRVLPVKLVHEGHDRYTQLQLLEDQLIKRKRELRINYHVIKSIVNDMVDAVEEQMAAFERGD